MEPDPPEPDPITDPLESLRWNWGEAYVIHNPAARVWTAERRDTHTVLRADTPTALRDAIVADYTARPVPRDDSPPHANPKPPRSARLRPV
jgi:hypothetical protein